MSSLSQESKDILELQVIEIKKVRNKSEKEWKDLKNSAEHVGARRDKAEKEFKDADKKVKAIENDLKP